MILAVKSAGKTCDVIFPGDPLQGLYMSWEWGGWATRWGLTHGSLVESIPAVGEDDADARLVEPRMTSLVVKEMTTGLVHEAEDDFTADEWAKLGEEVGLAKQGLLAADADPVAATAVEMQTDGPEPMIRLGALSMGGNPMRPRRRAVGHLYTDAEGEVTFGDLFASGSVFHDAYLRSDATSLGQHTLKGQKAERLAEGLTKGLNNRSVVAGPDGIDVLSPAIPLGNEEDALLAHGLPTHAIVLRRPSAEAGSRRDVCSSRR
jgi:hypothetical protein